MDQQDVKIFYDEKADVYYMSFGEPRPSICEEVEDGVLLRIDPETGEATGVTIVGFTRKFAGVPLSVPTAARLSSADALEG